MKRLLLAAGFFMAALQLRAQQNYDVSLIPKELMPYAGAVVRNSDEQVEVKDIGTTIYRIKKAITIFNESADGFAHLVFFYNKLRSIKYIKGMIYNADGKPEGKFSEKDFEDLNAADDALFEDARLKRFAPAAMQYPYTIEYEMEIRSKQTMYFPDWMACPEKGVAIENSNYSFSSKPDFKINIREINMPGGALVTTDKQGIQTRTWHVNGMKATRREPLSPDVERYSPMVKIAPQQFFYDGVTGSFTNWDNLGKWFYDKLLLNRDALSPETANYIMQLTSNITNPKEKARKIYEYMQSKTRYISIQIGIGGFRPFLADDVDKKGYGDCKALVNYTHALLKVAGIESYYCMVEAGDLKKSFMPDFASIDQGNHVILCIPFKNDTTWLECTNQKYPFGFLGDFTDDRWVLACTPNGGRLMHTPRYTAAVNTTQRKANLTINDAGELAGDMTTIFGGTEFDNRYGFIDEPYTEQVKAVRRIYAINNLDIEKLNYIKDKSLKPATTEQLTLNARDFAATNAGRHYFMVNLANRLTSVPPEVRNRTTEVYINRGYVDVDDITYTLPEGWKPDKQLLNEVIDKPFGKFMVRMSINGRNLQYIRRLQINDGTYSKDIYGDVVNFYQAISDADSYTITLVKN